MHDRMSDFGVQALTNIMWAASKMGSTDKELFDEAAEAIVSMAEGLKTQEMANLVWSYGNARHQHAQLMRVLMQKCLSR
jgi:hypothetical protein